MTIAIRGENLPGEVLVPCQGGSQTFTAYAVEQIPRHASVVVLDTRPGGLEVGRIN